MLKTPGLQPKIGVGHSAWGQETRSNRWLNQELLVQFHWSRGLVVGKATQPCCWNTSTPSYRTGLVHAYPLKLRKKKSNTKAKTHHHCKTPAPQRSAERYNHRDLLFTTTRPLKRQKAEKEKSEHPSPFSKLNPQKKKTSSTSSSTSIFRLMPEVRRKQ